MIDICFGNEPITLPRRIGRSLVVLLFLFGIVLMQTLMLQTSKLTKQSFYRGVILADD